jgi:predicted AAA+ superfamily ATPase
MLDRLCDLPLDRSVLLLGPRQTGKSTLVRHLLPKDAWTVDLLHHDSFLRYSKDPSQFRREAEAKLRGGAFTIFVDEVQKVPELLDEVHALIESQRVRFILSGSSARKLKRSGTNLLAGRATVRRLHPLTMSEQMQYFDLDRTLRLGSLPAVVTSDESVAIDLLRAYSQSYLQEEIQAEALVRNLGGFARFLEVAAAQCGDLLNYSAIGRDAAIATRTVQEYFQILEDTLLGYRHQAWRRSPRARLVAHSKFYFFDPGVTNAINQRLTAGIDPALRGRLFEQWIILECVRHLDYASSEARIYFWRTNTGAEVDLLIERHGKVRLAVEIKAKKRIATADLSGLRSFAANHPRVPLIAVGLNPQEYRLQNVDVLPYTRFFERLPEWTGG